MIQQAERSKGRRKGEPDPTDVFHGHSYAPGAEPNATVGPEG